MKKKVIITLAKKFPANHRRAGELTYFKEKIINTFLDEARVVGCDCCKYETRNCDECFNSRNSTIYHNNYNQRTKIHTIRINSDYWVKKCKQINEGSAELLLRQWKNRPYKDPQDKEFATLKKLGYQILKIEKFGQFASVSVFDEKRKKFKKIDLLSVAQHDGLSEEDFIDWFFPKNKNGIISAYVLHFTDFRY